MVAEPGPDAQEILAFLNTRLARYKIPKYVSFVAALPRTGTGKILKPGLRDLLAARPDQD